MSHSDNQKLKPLGQHKPKKNFVLGSTHAVNCRIICDARGEATNKNQDQAWHCWLTFCKFGGIRQDPFLTTLPNQGKELFIKSFLSIYITAS
jgi:hypothetical protein